MTGMSQQGPPDLDWREDTLPVSRQFDDPYYSAADGLAEARHVFLDGNRLSVRWAADGPSTTAPFTIAELGFGTGLNALAAALLRNQIAPDAPPIRFVSFELFPMSAAQMARAHAPWPELRDLSQTLCAAWPDQNIALPGLTLEVIQGDARATLPAWDGQADAWFLDGFAPARNPELWGTGLLATVHAKTARGGTFATYSAAGHVRRALTAAGFAVARLPGYGRKREMLAGARDAD